MEPWLAKVNVLASLKKNTSIIQDHANQDEI